MSVTLCPSQLALREQQIWHVVSLLKLPALSPQVVQGMHFMTKLVLCIFKHSMQQLTCSLTD